MKLQTSAAMVMSLPAIWLSAILCATSLLIIESNRVGQIEARYAKILNKCNLLGQFNAQITFRVGAPDLRGDDTASELASIRKTIAELSPMLDSSPQSAKYLAALNNYVDELNGWLFGSRAQRKRLSPSNPYGKLAELNSITRGLTTAELERLPSKSKLPAESTIYAALATSVISCIAVAVIWSLRLRREIEQLAENTDRFGARRKLKKSRFRVYEFERLNDVLVNVDKVISDTTQRQRALMKNAADVILQVDNEGKVTACNPFAERILGQREDAIVGSSIFDFLESTACLSFETALQQASQTGASNAAGLKLRHRLGKIVECECVVQKGEESGELFCVMKDVTERNEVDRLKHEFLELVTHDLRSPLTSIAGTLALLEAGAMGSIPPEAGTEAASARRSAKRIVGLVNDLLDFEKLQAGKMPIKASEFDLHELVSRLLADFHHAAGGSNISVKILGAPLVVHADSDRISQVLANLVFNAIKHSPVGGEVRIDWRRNGATVLVTVEDQGRGIPENSRETIFNAFEQLSHGERGDAGSGLGLAICKLIIDSHPGCTIGVESAKPRGSRFWFTLPVAMRNA